MISKPAKFNPLFGKQDNEITKKNISDRLSKHPYAVGMSGLNNNLIKKFKNNIELAKYLNKSKVTVGKYLNSDLIQKNQDRFKVNKK